MEKIQTPFTIHEADVAVWHAWGDGMPVSGPMGRHLGAMAEFRAGLRMEQAGGDAGLAGEVGEWRLNRPVETRAMPWVVEFSVPLAASKDGGAAVTALGASAGAPVVVVVRFRDRALGVWRVFQFHDAVILPVSAGEDAQRMMRVVRVSSGWLEDYKAGTMPSMEPRMRGVIEWKHLGRSIRCWEYDFAAGTWMEDPENVNPAESGPERYFSWAVTDDDLLVSMTAAATKAGELGGVYATGIEWKDVLAFELLEGSSNLTLAPGWVVEANGLVEPLLLPPSGRHWEHPRVVLRVLGRVYATIRAGVIAVPAINEGNPSPAPIDPPIRMGRLLFYPDGLWITL